MKFKRAAWLLLACLLALASCGVPTDPPETSDSSSPGPDTEMTTITPETNEPPVSVEIDLPGEADKLPAFPTTDLSAVTEGLGGAGLPVMSGEADENAPAIGEISKLTYPDETLAIAGYRLDNVKLILWTEGDLRAVVPLRSDATKTEATIPADMTRSTTLIWPYDENGVGAPVRINAPEIYWADPGRLYAGQTGQEVRFFGSGLWLEGHTPVVAAVFADGRTETLEIVDADPYQLRARLSSAPKAGETVRFYLHNGTGGACGWSEAFPMPVAVDTTADEKELTVFRVDDFGAVAGDGQDDLAAFRAAVSAAAKEDGGIIEFGPGEYNLGATWLITNKFTKGLYLRGAGMGDYDKKSGLGHDEYDHIGLSGTYTLLRFADPSSVKSKLIQIGSDNVFVSDMTIIGGDNGDHNSSNVFVGGTNLRFTSVRFIKTDLRDFAGGREISVGSNFEIDNYSSEITVSGCEFHQQGSAINIGNIEGIWPWGFFDSQRTIRNVRITGCDIYGYAGPYTAPDGRSAGDLGEMSRGMIGFNLQGLVFENNTIQGYDKANGKLLVRSIYVNATSEKCISPAIR